MQVTTFHVYERYIASTKSPSKESMLKSALVRFCIPFLGGPKPKGLRASQLEISEGINFLKEVPTSQICLLPTISEQAFDSLEVNGQTKRNARSHIKAFVAWAVECNYCKEKPIEEKQLLIERFHAPSGQARRDWHGPYKGYLGKTKKKPFALCAKKKGGELLFPDDYVNEKLKEEIEEFKKHYSEKVRPRTVEDGVVKIFQMLGWLHRFKKIPLESLSLNCIVDYTPLFRPVTQKGIKMDDILLEKALARQKGMQKAEESIEQFKEFMSFLGGHIESKCSYMRLLSSVAAFIYRKDYDNDDYPEWKDTPIAVKIRKLSLHYYRESEKSAPSVPHHRKSTSWITALQVLEKTRLRFKQEMRQSVTMRDGVQKRKRTDWARGQDLQDFLSLAFMILMPPLRSRCYYEMRIEDTLVYGAWDGSSFIPSNKIKDHSQTRWYLHLMPEDYKTGDRYGEYWLEVINQKFADGTTFYEYIEEWIYQWRELRGEPQHSYFFLGYHDNQPLNHAGWCGRIKKMFVREVDVPVSPKELRKMFVTFLKDSEVSESVLEAAACAQQHSRKTQSYIYDEQSKRKKIQPVLDFTQNCNNQVLLNQN